MTGPLELDQEIVLAIQTKSLARFGGLQFRCCLINADPFRGRRSARSRLLKSLGDVQRSSGRPLSNVTGRFNVTGSVCERDCGVSPQSSSFWDAAARRHNHDQARPSANLSFTDHWLGLLPAKRFAQCAPGSEIHSTTDMEKPARWISGQA